MTLLDERSGSQPDVMLSTRVDPQTETLVVNILHKRRSVNEPGPWGTFSHLGLRLAGVAASTNGSLS